MKVHSQSEVDDALETLRALGKSDFAHMDDARAIEAITQATLNGTLLAVAMTLLNGIRAAARAAAVTTTIEARKN